MREAMTTMMVLCQHCTKRSSEAYMLNILRNIRTMIPEVDLCDIHGDIIRKAYYVVDAFDESHKCRYGIECTKVDNSNQLRILGREVGLRITHYILCNEDYDVKIAREIQHMCGGYFPKMYSAVEHLMLERKRKEETAYGNAEVH